MGRIVVTEFISLDGVVEAQHVRERPRPGLGRPIRLAQRSLHHPQRVVGNAQAGVCDGEPDSYWCGGQVGQGFAQVHVTQCMATVTAGRGLIGPAWILPV